MPLLGRVGLAGMAMLTCVNPQVDDYDETLSILSNASLACKIKEITDLGRTTVGVVGVSAAAAAAAAAVPAGAHAQHKTSILSHHQHQHHRSSSLLSNKAGHAASALKRNSSKSSSSSSLESSEDAMIVDAADGSAPAPDESLLKELQKLRDEVTQLKAENQSLLVANFEKETEIRVEVANEMASRSMHLLEQIQDLQEQLDAKTDHFHDVTKSCKKARRKQIELENVETAKDLKEAEEELERVKAQYEIEIETLRSDKHSLEVELEEWKEKAEVSLAKVAELTEKLLAQPAAPVVSEQIVTVFQAPAIAVAPMAASRTSRSGSMSMPLIAEDAATVAAAAVVVVAASDEARKSAAAEQFSQRISRDQRFKKTVAAAADAAPQAVRSPLKHISANSPLAKAENDKNDKKRALSPKGVRSTSPVRKVQAVESKQPVMKQMASAAKENQAAAAPAPANKRPLRSAAMRAL